MLYRCTARPQVCAEIAVLHLARHNHHWNRCYLHTGWWVGRKQSRLWHTTTPALESVERVRVKGETRSQSNTLPPFLNPELFRIVQYKFPCVHSVVRAPSSPPSSPIFAAVCRNPSLPASPLLSPKTTVPSSACLSWNYPIVRNLQKSPCGLSLQLV
jgi:hypothetical protein